MVTGERATTGPRRDGPPPPRVLLLVLDGLSPRHVDPPVMPVLSDLARRGGWWPEGGLGVLPSSTYPNHATLVTGVPPSRHGLLANEMPSPDGPVPAWELGLSAATLFDSMRSAGRPSAAVFGDHHLVGATGAAVADSVWPPGGSVPDVALDVLGYAKDRETTARMVEVIAGGSELIVAQLNEPDTAAHIFGPDSVEALDRYGRTDACLGVIVEAIRPRWEEWVIIVVSDHSQEPVLDPDPVDLRSAAVRLGRQVRVVDDGAAAVVEETPAGDDDWLRTVPGVEDLVRLDDRTVLAWAHPGRWFSPAAYPIRGVHGSPRTAPQVAVVTGGHPGASALGAAVTARRPRSTDWAGAVAGLLGIPVPAGLAPPGSR